MKKLSLLFVLIVLISCGKDSDLIVKGQVKGLKKGTIYLEKEKDSSIIIVDSININGPSNFEFNTELDSPEAFYLRLDKKNSNETNTRIVFFADKGITEINTTLKNFVPDAIITGSEQQKLYEEFLKVIQRYDNKRLDLVKESFEAKMTNDSVKIEANQQALNNLTKSKYLYTVNFAVTNKNSEVAPYLALTEIYDAQTKWLDTINNSLTPKVKESKYGKALEGYIEIRKSKIKN
jgi:succinate dehydrogenase flavin-adding protein (antitoxin of CptAB toxin-antitoxin module)